MFKAKVNHNCVSVRRELGYKFGSIIIFSSGRAKFDLGSGSEQMLDAYTASLICRLVCRGDFDPQQRAEAIGKALVKMGLPADIYADREYALDFARLALSFGKIGKTMKYVDEFMLSSVRLLQYVESYLAAEYPESGLGNLSHEIVNAICDSLSVAKVKTEAELEENKKQAIRKSAAEWIAAAAAAAMLPILL